MFSQTGIWICRRRSQTAYFSDMKNSQVKDNWNRVSTVWNDVYTNNGIIHILSPQHSFGFDEFIYVFNNYGNEYKK